MMLAGLVMIPLPIPGPGWVTLFLGLAVLSTEFAWAHRVTSFIRRQFNLGSIGFFGIHCELFECPAVTSFLDR